MTNPKTPRKAKPLYRIPKRSAASANPAPASEYADPLAGVLHEDAPAASHSLNHQLSTLNHSHPAPRASSVVPPHAPSPAPRASLVYSSSNVWLYHGNCLELLDAIAAKYPEGRFDMIFADPPYFLSNGGITCHAGKMVSVHKGDWDQSRGWEWNHEFNTEWLRRCQRVLKPNGTLWVTGTHHVIFSVGFALQQLGYKILNDVAWEKPNPPPNLSCRYFTHSTETVLWAAKNDKSKHTFNYKEMKAVTGKQMKTVWTMTAPGGAEKTHGKHPTQKPVALVERCLLASTNPSDLVLDPFMGGGTTGVACIRLQRRFVGTEMDAPYLGDLYTLLPLTFKAVVFVFTAHFFGVGFAVVDCADAFFAARLPRPVPAATAARMLLKPPFSGLCIFCGLLMQSVLCMGVAFRLRPASRSAQTPVENPFPAT